MADSVPVTTEARAKRLRPAPFNCGAQGFLHRTDCGDAAVFQHHDPRGEPRDLLDGVGDVNDGNAKSIAQGFDQGQNFQLPFGVERGERLVHEQERGRGQERAADGHPLLLAARKKSGLPPSRWPMPSVSTTGSKATRPAASPANQRP